MAEPAAQPMPEAPRFASAAMRARPLTRQEVPALQALFDASPEYFQIVEGRPASPDTAQVEFDERPPAHLPWRWQWVLGVEDLGGRLQGCIVLTEHLCAEGVGHIGLFWLATPLHGQGLGAGLYQALEAWARARGLRWLRLGVVQGNGPAERFWARHGFQTLRERQLPREDGSPRCVHTLLKPLAAPGLDAAAVADYLALVPRDQPGSPLP